MKLNFCRCSKTEKLVKYCVDKLNKGIKKKKIFLELEDVARACVREMNTVCYAVTLKEQRPL